MENTIFGDNLLGYHYEMRNRIALKTPEDLKNDFFTTMEIVESLDPDMYLPEWDEAMGCDEEPTGWREKWFKVQVGDEEINYIVRVLDVGTPFGYIRGFVIGKAKKVDTELEAEMDTEAYTWMGIANVGCLTDHTNENPTPIYKTKRWDDTEVFTLKMSV